MTDVHLRPATRADAADIALLDNIAGHGISLWFWLKETESGLVEDALALGRMRLSQPTAFYGVPNATVAVENEMILGSVTSYVMPEPDGESEQMKRTAPAFAPLFELFDLVAGHWFIDSLGVYPEGRRRGIGTLLLEGALDRGKTSGCTECSLVVEDSNGAARAMYEARGFEVVDRRTFVEFQGPSATKEWLLLSRTMP